ncbi:MAG: hypothetical protein M0Z55_08035 [Peptococcaceae bacterium]|nr:hypothetical protein [Peptococcaceae bacterium]
MNFPIGSVSVLILLVLLLFNNIIDTTVVQRRVLIVGFAAILLGSWLIVPVPSPKAVQVELNVGQSLLPALIGLIAWLDLPQDEKYHASLGTLAVGLFLYGFTGLIDIEPGIMGYPLLFSLPLTVIIARLTAKTTTAATLALVGGSSLVILLRYIESAFTFPVNTVVDLPGQLLWNTTSLAIVGSFALVWFKQQVKLVRQRIALPREEHEDNL